jgi:hypothetical protein
LPRSWTAPSASNIASTARIDPRLEAVRPGERLCLLEIGSDRVIHAVVVRVSCRPHEGRYRYAITFSDVRPGRAQGVRKIQGWHRRESLRH